jgi:uncharacterized protein YukE
VIDLAGITALPGLLGRVEAIRSSMLQLGEPARLAGDPSGIRHLAAGHLASSGRLTAAQERGRAHVSRLLDASWTGEASRSFAGYWADLERRLGRLAADHQRMAAALDCIAGDCERLNRDAMALAGGIESWLRKATDAVVAQDVQAARSLVSEAMALVTGWERLLGDLESLAASLAGRINVNLDFVRRTVEINVPGQLPAGFPLPGRERSPMGRGGSIRIGPWGRIPIPPPSHPISGRFPPGTDPWPPDAPREGPSKRRKPRPTHPPSAEPGTAALPGGAVPVYRPAPPPKPNSTPVHQPTAGPPEHLPLGPIHPPIAGPVHTPVDLYIFQTATLVVMIGQKVKAVVRRLRGGKKGGNQRGGGKGAKRG